MGQSKKERNLSRNLMKKALRQRATDEQIKNHNAAVYATAFVESAIKKDDGLNTIRDAMEGYYRVDPSEYYIDCDEPEYRILIQAEGDADVVEFENARAKDIDMIVAKVWDKSGSMPSYEKEIMGYRPRLMRRQEDGTYLSISAGNDSYPTVSQAQQAGGIEMPVVAIKSGDTFSYPYMKEAKEKLMAQARERRKKREQKLLAHMGVAMVLGGHMPNL